MARIPVAKTTLIGPYYDTLAANALDVAFTAADIVEFNSIAFGNSGRMLVLIRNTSTTTAYTFTITSFADEGLGFRSKDVAAYSLAAGEVGQYVVTRLGWEQADGLLYLQGNNAAIEFAAMDI